MAALTVAVSSLVYAVAYLFVAPSEQRGSDISAFFRSYAAHPAGMRVASVCLAVSGVVTGIAAVALRDRCVAGTSTSLRWATTAAVAGGLFTAAHGLQGLIEVDRLAHRFTTGDAATRAAIVVVHAAPAPTDPRGLATFGLAGLVALVFGGALRAEHRGLGRLGLVYGADLALLFAATAAGADALVLLTGGLASVALGPAWWIGVARLLWTDTVPATAPRTASTDRAPTDRAPTEVHR